MKHESLPVGEKYLEIQIIGHYPIFVFRNKEYLNDNEPLFIREGIKVFVRTKQEPKTKINNEYKRIMDELF